MIGFFPKSKRISKKFIKKGYQEFFFFLVIFIHLPKLKKIITCLKQILNKFSKTLTVYFHENLSSKLTNSHQSFKFHDDFFLPSHIKPHK